MEESDTPNNQTKKPDHETLEARLDREKNPIKRLLMILGPGLITGASDDDPSGIGTYTQAGAAFGFTTLWTAPVTLPMMAAVQFICAKIGLVSGMGPAGAAKVLSALGRLRGHLTACDRQYN